MTVIPCRWVELDGQPVSRLRATDIPLQRRYQLRVVTSPRSKLSQPPDLQALRCVPQGSYRTLLYNGYDWARTANFSTTSSTGQWMLSADHALIDDLNPNRSDRLWRKHPKSYVLDYYFSGTSYLHSIGGQAVQEQFLTKPIFTIEWKPQADRINAEDLRALALKGLGAVLGGIGGKVIVGKVSATVVAGLAAFAAAHGAHAAYLDVQQTAQLMEFAIAAMQPLRDDPTYHSYAEGLLKLHDASLDANRPGFVDRAVSEVVTSKIPWQLEASRLSNSSRSSMAAVLSEAQSRFNPEPPASGDGTRIYQILFIERGFNTALSGELRKALRSKTS
jgi:hypothetical protein